MPRARSACISASALLVLFLDQCTILADFPPKGPIAPQVLSGPPLMALGVADAFADPLALELGDRSKDSEH
jgi:hypothetical protein